MLFPANNKLHFGVMTLAIKDRGYDNYFSTFEESFTPHSKSFAHLIQKFTGLRH
jgi:hypothetical protein